MGKTVFTLLLLLLTLGAPNLTHAKGGSVTSDEAACVLVQIETTLPNDPDPSINKLKEWQSRLKSEQAKPLTEDQIALFRKKEGLDSSLSDAQVDAIYQIQARWLETRVDIEMKRRLYSRVSTDSSRAALEAAIADAMDHLKAIAPNDAPIAEVTPQAMRDLIKTTMSLTGFNEPLPASALSALIQIHGLSTVKIQIRRQVFSPGANESEIKEQVAELEHAQEALLSQLPFKKSPASMSEKTQKTLVLKLERSTRDTPTLGCCGRNCGVSCPYLVGVNPLRKAQWFLTRQLSSISGDDSENPDNVPPLLLFSAREDLKDLIPKAGLRPPGSRSKRATDRFIGSDPN